MSTTLDIVGQVSVRKTCDTRRCVSGDVDTSLPLCWCVCVCVSGPCGRFRHFPGSQTNVRVSSHRRRTDRGWVSYKTCFCEEEVKSVLTEMCDSSMMNSLFYHFRCHSNLSGAGEKMTKSVVVKIIRP